MVSALHNTHGRVEEDQWLGAVFFIWVSQVESIFAFKNPKKYIDVNILGFHNLINCCKQIKVNKIIYASSSSVYGEINKFPLNENLNLKPKNLYGLSKKFNEELAEVYSNFYKMKFTGLRLFTVYGEWGRPDMFFYKYLTSSKANKTFYLNNFGYILNFILPIFIRSQCSISN